MTRGTLSAVLTQRVVSFPDPMHVYVCTSMWLIVDTVWKRSLNQNNIMTFLELLVPVVKKIEVSLGQRELYHCLKVRPSLKHTLVSQCIKFSCQA